jgi:hypothetical protein
LGALKPAKQRELPVKECCAPLKDLPHEELGCFVNQFPVPVFSRAGRAGIRLRNSGGFFDFFDDQWLLLWDMYS